MKANDKPEMEDLVAAATSKISELVVVMAGGWNTTTIEQVFTAGSRTRRFSPSAVLVGGGVHCHYCRLRNRRW
jgi:hypothetical protein